MVAIDVVSKAEAAAVADDILVGAAAIAVFLYGDARRRGTVYYLCEKGGLPHFRLGDLETGRIHARKSVLRDWIAKREAMAAGQVSND